MSEVHSVQIAAEKAVAREGFWLAGQEKLENLAGWWHKQAGLNVYKVANCQGRVQKSIGMNIGGVWFWNSSSKAFDQELMETIVRAEPASRIHLPSRVGVPIPDLILRAAPYMTDDKLNAMFELAGHYGYDQMASRLELEVLRRSTSTVATPAKKQGRL